MYVFQASKNVPKEHMLMFRTADLQLGPKEPATNPKRKTWVQFAIYPDANVTNPL